MQHLEAAYARDIEIRIEDEKLAREHVAITVKEFTRMASSIRPATCASSRLRSTTAMPSSQPMATASSTAAAWP